MISSLWMRAACVAWIACAAPLAAAADPSSDSPVPAKGADKPAAAAQARNGSKNWRTICGSTSRTNGSSSTPRSA